MQCATDDALRPRSSILVGISRLYSTTVWLLVFCGQSDSNKCQTEVEMESESQLEDKKIEPMQFRAKRFSVKNTVAGGELSINNRADNSFIR